MQSIYRLESPSSNFTIIPNSVLQTSGLSPAEKGFLDTIISYPSDWKFTVDWITSTFGWGQTHIRSIIKNLIKKGYIYWRKVRDSSGKFLRGEYYFYQDPSLNKFGNKETDENLYTDLNEEVVVIEKIETMKVIVAPSEKAEVSEVNKKEIPFLELGLEEGDLQGYGLFEEDFTVPIKIEYKQMSDEEMLKTIGAYDATSVFQLSDSLMDAFVELDCLERARKKMFNATKFGRLQDKYESKAYNELLMAEAKEEMRRDRIKEARERFKNCKQLPDISIKDDVVSSSPLPAIKAPPGQPQPGKYFQDYGLINTERKKLEKLKRDEIRKEAKVVAQERARATYHHELATELGVDPAKLRGAFLDYFYEYAKADPKVHDPASYCGKVEQDMCADPLKRKTTPAWTTFEYIYRDCIQKGIEFSAKEEGAKREKASLEALFIKWGTKAIKFGDIDEYDWNNGDPQVRGGGFGRSNKRWEWEPAFKNSKEPLSEILPFYIEGYLKRERLENGSAKK